MTVMSDQPGIQFYSGQGLHQKGHNGQQYAAYSGFALETQHYPDSPNKPQWPSVVLRPGEQYHSHCIFSFGVK